MKNKLVPLILFFSLAACQKEAPPPFFVDPEPTVSTSKAERTNIEASAAVGAMYVTPIGTELALLEHTWIADKRILEISAEDLPASWTPIFVTELEKTAPEITQVADQKLDGAALQRAEAWWCGGIVHRWNEIMRGLVSQHGMNSAYSSRAFAATAVAQHDAAWHARKQSITSGVRSELPKALSCGHYYLLNDVSVEVATSRASAEMLMKFFPESQAFIVANHIAVLAVASKRGASKESVLRGSVVGFNVAKQVLARLETDGSAKASRGAVPKQHLKWFAESQTLPGWGKVQPWVIETEAFVAPPPPKIPSEQFDAQINEVYQASLVRSAENWATARFWDLGVGGVSVPGMWDQIALRLSSKKEFTELADARMLALMNVAMMDALVACWESKFRYLVPRPIQVLPGISTVMYTPSHPAYPSGHSAFSGAAEQVLSVVFPEHAGLLHKMAEEASASRWYGAIHYRMDGDAGLAQGRNVSDAVMKKFPF